MRMFYVYFHDADSVPIHVEEVVREMQRQGCMVDLFAHHNARKVIGSSPYCRKHLGWTPRIRFLSELIFMVQLLPLLLYQAFVHRPDAIYVRHSGISIVAAFVARMLGLPCLIEVNDIQTDRLKFVDPPKLKLAWVDFYNRISFRQATRMLPNTHQIGNWIAETYHISKNRITVIPNGVNTSRFIPRLRSEARKKYGLDEEKKIIVCLGSLFPWAGIETLIEALPAILARNPELFVMIGSNEEPYLSQIKELVEKRGFQAQVGFYGFIPWNEASWFISCADLCASPYVFKDKRSGLSSLRVLSYLSCGRPVVGSDIPGLGDMLEANKVGVSFKMGNSTDMAAKVVDLFAKPAELKSMGERARDFVENDCTWESVVKRIFRSSLSEE